MTKVLSLRGGGMRGYATAILLARLEKQLQKPLADVFDLIAGTSVGGIMATSVALKIPCEQLIAFFETEGPQIFKSRMFFKLFQMAGHPRFDVRNLTAALERHFMKEAILAHTYTKLMVTSTRYRGLESRIWKSWKHVDMSAVEVAASSAAAVTYFDPVTIADFAHGDGGYFSNNPVDCAVIEARKLWPAHHQVVIDIACPDDKQQWEPQGGLLDAAPHIASMFIGAGEDIATYKAKHLLGNGRILTIQPPLLNANHDIGDASPRNLRELQKCAEYRLERNVDDIIALIGT